MPDLVFGIAEFGSSTAWWVLDEAAKRVGVNVVDVGAGKRLLLPEPSSEESIFYDLGDPGSSEANYLVDGIDYAPGAEIGLPLGWRERFSRVVDWVELVLASGQVERLWIAISDGFDHEKTTRLRVDEARAQLFHDMEGYAPPNILYCIEP